MTAARRTPRYVGIIGAEPMGPQLMGPHPAPHAPQHGPATSSMAAMSHYAARRDASSGILPLHRDQPGSYTPDFQRAPSRPAIVPDAVAPALPLRPSTPVVPLHRRPWRVLIVSASPHTAPRSFEVSRWQARATIAAMALGATLALGFVASVVVAVRTPELFADRGEMELMRAELAATRDSLAMARTELADSTSADSGDDDSTSVALPAAAAAKPAPAVKAPVIRDRPRPLSRHTRLEDDAGRELAVGGESGAGHEPGIAALLPRSFADMPVIGALASGFSLARRHPLLHRVRPHLGVDLAAPRGTRVSAPAAGRVTFVGRKLGFGLVVELDHGDGISTRYAHLRSAAVQAGEHVTRGEAIAAVGTSGITTGPHLHYEVLVHGRQVDPLRFRFAQNEAATAAPSAPVPAVAGSVTPAAGNPSGGVVGMGAHDAAAASLPTLPR